MDCINNCKDCIKDNSNICTACSTPFYLLNSDCVAICPTGKFKYDLTRTCEGCLSKCISCLNYNNCTSCAVGFFKKDS